MAKRKQVEPIVGEELLKKVKELEHLSKEEKAKACGYYTISKNGTERINMMQFLNALIDAEGIDLDSNTTTQDRSGRIPSYRAKVQSNGSIIVGSAYTKQVGLQPGDEFEINLGRKHIYLKKIAAEAA